MRRGAAELPASFMRTSYELITPAMKRHVLRLYRTLDPVCFRGWEDALPQLTARIPACVLWGDRDPYIPLHFAGRFGCPVYHFPRLGHWLHGEDPVAIAERLAAHLTG